MAQYVYFFGGGKADGNKDMKDMLGGKGAGLAEMTNAGLPVPPGFTITTAGLRHYNERGGKLPPEIEEEIENDRSEAREGLTARSSATPTNPLLVSVRSRREVLDAGHDGHDPEPRPERRAVEGLKRHDRQRRFAKDSYRRFIQMYGNVVLGDRQGPASSTSSTAVKKKRRAKVDIDLDAEALSEVVARYKRRVKQETRQGLPAGPARAAPGRDRRRLQVVDEPARDHVPQAERHPRRPRHRRQRAGDGVRQHGRRLGHRRRLHAQPLDRREASSTASSCRTRRARTWWPASARRSRSRELEKAMPKAYRAAARDHDAPRAALQGRAGLRVHDRGGQAVHAPDPQRQAHGVAAVHIAVDIVEEGIPTPKEAVLKVEPSQLAMAVLPVLRSVLRIAATQDDYLKEFMVWVVVSGVSG